MYEKTSRLKFENEGNSEEYEVEAIRDSAVYAKESDNGYHLPGLYYLVSCKGHPEEENTWEPASAVLHLCKLNSIFYHNNPGKLAATSPSIDSALPMVKLTAKPKAKTLSTKRKQSQPTTANGTSKRTKKSWTSSFLSRFWPCLDSRQKISIVTWSRSAPPCSLIFRFFSLLHFHTPFGFSS